MENNEMNIQNETNLNGNNTNMPTNKGNGGLKAIIVVLSLAVIGFAAYLVYDKVINKDKTEIKPTPTPSDESKINVEVKDNMLYVNGNKVDLYSVSSIKNNYENENEFYCSNVVGKSAQLSTYPMKDIVLVKFTPCNYEYQYVENYFVDASGKVLKTINGKNADIELSINDTVFGVEKIDGNQIYLSTTVDRAKYYGGVVCNKIKENKGNEIVEYTDKITYENGEFKLDKAVETKTYNEYFENGNNIDSCSVKSNNIEGIDNYKIAYIDVLNRLKLVKAGERIDLVTLDKSANYGFIESRYIDSNDIKCNASKNGIYIFLTDNETNSTTYVIFYDTDTGEKSDLLNVTNGSADSLITCN